MQICSVTRLARINSIVGIVLNNYNNELQKQPSAPLIPRYIHHKQGTIATSITIITPGLSHTCYRKASQSPIPSWATNQQVLIIFFCAFRNKGEGAPAISDLVQRENNGTGYWIVNMSDSYFGWQQYVIYCSQLRATPSPDCNISHIAVGRSKYLIHLAWACILELLRNCIIFERVTLHSERIFTWVRDT